MTRTDYEAMINYIRQNNEFCIEQTGWEMSVNDVIGQLESDDFVERFVETDYTKVTSQGYEVIALVLDGYHHHAIVKRACDFQPYVFCYAYDIIDGTWGNGHYFDTYQQACNELARHLV